METKKYMRSPFPYFGSKILIADTVWEYLKDVKNYIEPFFGSGAVYFRRPNYDPNIHYETINDKDNLLINVWRSIKYKPEETAKYADNLVSQVDMHAYRRELYYSKDDLKEKMILDPEYCDPKLAGYWIYLYSIWIGGRQIPSKEESLTTIGVPELASYRGITKKSVKSNQSGELGEKIFMMVRKEGYSIYDWFEALSERLRYTRITCGDWKQVLGGNWAVRNGTAGIFLDPPYSENSRGLYIEDTISHEVREWCKENGNRDKYKIILAGYYDEHQELLNYGWKVHRWEKSWGYGNLANGKGKIDMKKEALFISPYCINNSSEKRLL